MQVLIVEDDASVARFLHRVVTQCGYAAQVVTDGLEALSVAATASYDLIVLDIVVPCVDGFEVTRRLRSQMVTTPILMVTGQNSVSDRVHGLDCGADDYLPKPFDVDELLARVRALMRRGGSGPACLQVADLVLDPAARRVTRGGETISLSATEYSLLEYMMRNPRRVLTRVSLISHVWDYDFSGNENVLEVYVSYLRRKIDRGRLPALIHTVRGVGYRLGM